MLTGQVVVPSRLLPQLLGHAEREGLDLAALCDHWEIKLCRDDEGKLPTAIDVSVERQRQIFDDVATRLNDLAVGARLGMSIPRGTYGLLEFASHMGPDLQAVVDTTIETTPLVSPVVTLELKVHGGFAELHHHVDVEGGYGRQAAEMTVGAIFIGGRRAVGERLTMHEVWIAHPGPSSTSEREAIANIFGCSVRYDAATSGFSFAAELLTLPTLVYDDALHAFLLGQASRELQRKRPGPVDPFVVQVSGVVEATLEQGVVVEMGGVAKTLAVSPRTLQRRLAERGTNLSKVLDEVRERDARRRLLDPETRVEDVAAALGFADVSAFSRAFRRWTQQTPTAWRQRATSER